jgi:threonine 3-dehydrogenase
MQDTKEVIPQKATYPMFRGNRTIEFVEKEVPEPATGQLLIQCRANALCASDFGQYYNGSNITPGHEAAGVVVAVGADTKTPIGTSGAVFLMGFCGQCRHCSMGITNLCLNKRADYGFSHDGGYGPYAVINENVFFPTGDDISPAEATLLLDIMGTGGHANRRAQHVHLNIDSLLVTGAGPIGLGVLAMAKLLHGEDMPVMITDMVPYRLELAERMGGLPINVKDTDLSTGLKYHGFDAVDVAIDTSGTTVARRTSMDLLALRGVQVCVGHGGELPLNVSPDLIAGERTVVGSEYFTYQELPESLKLLRAHRNYLDQIITHRFPVKEIDEAYRQFVDRNTGKVIVEQ